MNSKQTYMKRDLYYRSDIQNVLKSIQHTNDAISSYLSSESFQSYQAGFQAAIDAIAVAFNVEIAEEKAEGRSDTTIHSSRRLSAASVIQGELVSGLRDQR